MGYLVGVDFLQVQTARTGAGELKREQVSTMLVRALCYIAPHYVYLVHNVSNCIHPIPVETSVNSGKRRGQTRSITASLAVNPSWKTQASHRTPRFCISHYISTSS